MLRFYTVNFYHNDQIGLFEKDMPAEGYLLVGRRDFEGFKPKYESEYTLKKYIRARKEDVTSVTLFTCIVSRENSHRISIE